MNKYKILETKTIISKFIPKDDPSLPARPLAFGGEYPIKFTKGEIVDANIVTDFYGKTFIISKQRDITDIAELVTNNKLEIGKTTNTAQPKKINVKNIAIISFVSLLLIFGALKLTNTI